MLRQGGPTHTPRGDAWPHLEPSQDQAKPGTRAPHTVNAGQPRGEKDPAPRAQCEPRALLQSVSDAEVAAQGTRSPDLWEDQLQLPPSPVTQAEGAATGEWPLSLTKLALRLSRQERVGHQSQLWRGPHARPGDGLSPGAAGLVYREHGSQGHPPAGRHSERDDAKPSWSSSARP